MVGDRGLIRLRAHQTEDQARTRLDRVRALFPDGVVWLRVGKGAGAADRLPPLMLELAKRLLEDLVEQGVDPPAPGEDGGSYVKKIVSQESLRCLVVADDVWEAQVVRKLRETGLWVLLTTRFPEIVETYERVAMNRLEQAEAEDVLRSSAELPPGESLCDAAKEVLEICGHVAMDIAFVGSWSSVRATNGKAKSSKAWAGAVEQIRSAQAQISDAGGVDDRDVNRIAVLHTGFKYLGREDPLAQELYAALAVLPNGHAFAESDAAVLLGDEEVANDQILILERWAVLRGDACGRYRIHDTHVDFAREKPMGWEATRQPAICRWTSHISRLDVAVGIDFFALFDIWQMLKQVGGEGLWVSQPYNDQLVQLDASDRFKSFAINVVADLNEQGAHYTELEELMRKIVEHYADHGRPVPKDVEVAALFHLRHGLLCQGRFEENSEVAHRLGELVGPSLQLEVQGWSDDPRQASTTYITYGVCAVHAGHHKAAEDWFRKALKAQEDCGLAATATSPNAFTLHELGKCVMKAGRHHEAAELLARALEIKEARLGPDDPNIAWTLHEMGRWAQEMGRLAEAEELLLRALEIKKAKLGGDHMQVAVTFYSLGQCVRTAGRPGEAQTLFRRALEIEEAKLGADHPEIALTLPEVGRSVREAGRPAEAEALFRRALEIKEAKFGADHRRVSWTLCWLGGCVREAGRPAEAESLFRRALEINEVKLGADHVDVAKIRLELDRCAKDAGAPAETE